MIINRGQTASSIEAMIGYSMGMWGIIAVITVTLLASIGVLIGRRILQKYQPDHAG